MSDEDTNRLINHCLSFAKAMVENRGEFFPFAATVAPGAVVAHIQPQVGSDESEEAWRRLLENVARTSIANDAACAAALCFNGRVWPRGKSHQPSPAILIEVEDAAGECFQVAQLYKKKKIFKGYAFGERLYAKQQPKLFRGSPVRST